jgi:hypothetical protein
MSAAVPDIAPNLAAFVEAPMSGKMSDAQPLFLAQMTTPPAVAAEGDQAPIVAH